MTADGFDLPKIISVDDHVVEPPDLWTKRLPARYQDVGPRVVRDRAKFSFTGGVFSYEKGVPDGEWCDWWLYDELVYPFPKLSAAIGFDDLDVTPTTYDEIRPGCWIQSERLADMTANHVEASICFPNTLPRFCGQTFYEQGVKREGGDPELALLCVKAYNDWMIDEWCAGEGKGRLIPLTMIPLWDAELAAAEVRRCAGLGSHAVAFSENPHPLGLPSIHSGALGPVLHRLPGDRDRRVHAHRLVVADAGHLARRPVHRVVDAHVPERHGLDARLHLLGHPRAVPHAEDRLLRGPGRLDALRARAGRQAVGRAQRQQLRHVAAPARPPATSRAGSTAASSTTRPACRNRDAIGIDQICFETDYPHADSTFPHSKKVAHDICTQAGLDETETYKLLRGNAITAFGLERFGITK